MAAKLVKGSDIMLFVKDGDTYKSLAHASSHTLTLNADVESINTKDAGKWGMSEVNKINWEIQASHFYTSEAYDTLFSYMIDGTTLNVAFGLKTGPNTETVNLDNDTYTYWTTAYTAGPYVGRAIITSLEWQAEAGSKSTFSATLQGQGDISKMTQA